MKKQKIFALIITVFSVASAFGQACGISGPDNVCINQSTTFYPNCPPEIVGIDGYQWRVDGVYAGNQNNLGYTFTSVGTYQVTLYYTVAGDIVAGPGDKYVTVIDAPVAPIIHAYPEEVCNAGNVTLTIVNPQIGITYNWYSPSNFIGSGSQLVVNNVNQLTRFTVNASNGECSSLSFKTIGIVNTTAFPELDPRNFYHKKILRTTSNSTDKNWHYWQTSSGGTSISQNAVGEYIVTSPQDYYLRRTNSDNTCWTTASSPVSVTISYVPPLPAVMELKKPGVNEIFFIDGDKTNVLTYADFYWVHDNTSNPQITGEFIVNNTIIQSKFFANGTYYLKGKDRATGTWGPTLTLNVQLRVDEGINWVHTKAFDGTSNAAVISESKSYFDDEGKPLQSQRRNIENNYVFATQSLKDKYDRVVGSTLPGPITSKEFTYNSSFLLNEVGNQYTAEDFDEETTKYNPNPVGDEQPGTLGWYYSANNNIEDYVPSTNYPYSRIEFYEDGTGEVKRSASPGNYHRLGMGHEGLTGTFPVFSELNHYIKNRSNAIPGFVHVNNLRNEGVQTISRDENGKYVISITDKSGKTVMTARNGSPTDSVLRVNNVVIANVADNAKKMVYFYLLNSQPVTIVPNAAGENWIVENIVTGQKLDPKQTFAEAGGNWPIGFYRLTMLSGEVTVTYSNFYLDVSYQFYDDMERLKTSVSPNGFKAWKTGTAYSNIDKTTYNYNFRGWLLSMTEPDAGTTTYKYRRDGKIRFSQNAQQGIDNRFSYTHYDNLGRPIESGEYKGTVHNYDNLSSQLEFNSQVIYTGSEVKDWVKTYYDFADANFYTATGLPSTFTQDFVRGGVAYTENANIKTWYSYDELGRVTWMAQKPTALSRVFVSTYEYDFLGNVLRTSSLAYESGALLEQFHHHYEYDKDKRLSRAFTSVDGTTKKLRATYSYYLHGPLKRIELGGKLVNNQGSLETVSEVQGIDFVYNINGWLTQINHPNKNSDPGGDNNDAFGMVLDYYESEMQGLFPTALNTKELNRPELFHKLPSEHSTENQRFAWMKPELAQPASQNQWSNQVNQVKDYFSRNTSYEQINREAAPSNLTAQIESVEITSLSDQQEQIDDVNLSLDEATLVASTLNTIVSPMPAGAVDDALEFAALKAIYDSLGGSGWTTKTAWPTPGNWPASATATQMDAWHGITVTNGDITMISLVSNHLVGKIPSAVSNLAALKTLYLNTNSINGKLPSSLGSITTLQNLRLHGNTLSGSIPTTFGNLSNLKELLLYNNQLSGSIPSQLGSLSGLLILNLTRNKFTGEIPSSIGSLTALTGLHLDDNLLSGSVPSALNNLTNLTALDLSLNNFTGDFPDLGSLVNLTNLTVTHLPNINAGPIGSWIGNLTKLTTLNLESTKRTGSIPSSIGNLIKLQILILRANQLTGGIPSEIGGLVELKNLYLYNNQLSGSLPSSIYTLPKIENIGLSSNSLSGSISPAIGNLTKLITFNLAVNNFTGNIPAEIGELTLLQELQLNSNQLSGSIPSSINNLSALKILYVNHNQMTGDVPPMSNLTAMMYLQVNSNQFTGAIGSWIGNMANLRTLRIDVNKFTSIANQILQNSLMTVVNLEQNSLTSIPNFYTYGNKANLSLQLENNYFDFSDLEPLFGTGTHGIKTFDWAPQKKFSAIEAGKLHVPAGSLFEINAQSKGQYSSVTWEKQIGTGAWTNVNTSNENATHQSFKISNATLTINGNYRWKMSNTRVTGLTLECNPIEVLSVDALPAQPGEGSMFNGIISSMRWRTNEAYGTGQGDLKGMYQFKYDDKYQIEDANWAEPDDTLNTFATAANKYRVTNLSYDPNGNILSLNRYDANALRTNNFTYTLKNRLSQPGWSGTDNNQLQSVSGYVSSYTYNAIGQMTAEDKVTGSDQYVEYDVTGKVVKVFDAPSKTTYDLKVEYLYDDRGFRLAKKTFNAAGAIALTTWYIRDASGNILSIYEQQPNQEIVQTEIPIYGSGKLATVYPQQDGSAAYEITDHLGNVRALVKEQVTVYTATMEDNGQSDITNPRVQELAYFENLFETEVNDPHMNHTPEDATLVQNPSKSAYLYWVSGTPGMDAIDKAVGPAIALKVNAGDTIKAEAYVRYRNETSYTRSGFTISLLSSLLGNSFAFTGGFEGANTAQTTQSFSNALTSGGFLGDGTDDTRPYAYLNYIVLDASYNRISSGWQRVTEAAEFSLGEEAPIPIGADMHEKVKLSAPVVIGSTGKYVYVWVSNESQGARVWFDDVTVTHTTTYIAQATDYGVWGDVLREQISALEEKYRFGYQGQFAEKDEETGWNHFELREFDPVIGRWTVVDPYGQYWSPYLGMGNNAINSVDPDGGFAIPDLSFLQGADFQIWLADVSGTLLDAAVVNPNFWTAFWEDFSLVYGAGFNGTLGFNINGSGVVPANMHNYSAKTVSNVDAAFLSLINMGMKDRPNPNKDNSTTRNKDNPSKGDRAGTFKEGGDASEDGSAAGEDVHNGLKRREAILQRAQEMKDSVGQTPFGKVHGVNYIPIYREPDSVRLWNSTGTKSLTLKIKLKNQ